MINFFLSLFIVFLYQFMTFNGGKPVNKMLYDLFRYVARLYLPGGKTDTLNGIIIDSSRNLTHYIYIDFRTVEFIFYTPFNILLSPRHEFVFMRFESLVGIE